FNLISFGDSASQMEDELLPASAENTRRALAWLDRASATGTSEGMEDAFRRAAAARPQRIVFLTDGDVTGPQLDGAIQAVNRARLRVNVLVFPRPAEEFGRGEALLLRRLAVNG